MGVTESARRLWVVTSLTLRYLLGTRRVIAMLLLSAIPFILALSLAAGRVSAFNIDLFQRLMIPLFLQVVLIFVTLVNAPTLIREEIEDNTLPYLLKSILQGMIAVGPMTTYGSDISAGIAVLILVGFSVAMIVLAMMLFQQMEFRQKA